MADEPLSEDAKGASSAENKKTKNTQIVNALLIGVCVGIVLWSVVQNTWGFFTLIPLFFIYKMVNSAKNDK